MVKLLLKSQSTRRFLYLTAMYLLLGGSNLVWTSHSISTSQQQIQATNARSIENAKLAAIKSVQTAIDINNRSWCDSLAVITSGPAPSAKQSGVVRLYADFHQLERKFGCNK